MIFEYKNLYEFWKIKNGEKKKGNWQLPQCPIAKTKPYIDCSECGVAIHLNKHLEHGQPFLCMFCFSHTVEGASILRVATKECSKCGWFQNDDICSDCGCFLADEIRKRNKKISSAEDVIQAANECAKESQRNGAPMTDEDALNLVKNS